MNSPQPIEHESQDPSGVFDSEAYDILGLIAVGTSTAAYGVQAAHEHVAPAALDVAKGFTDGTFNYGAEQLSSVLHTELPSQIAAAAEAHPTTAAIVFGVPAVLRGMSIAVRRLHNRYS